jgi:hypothetical protein
LNQEYYTIEQIAGLTGWSRHDVSQRAPLAHFERITAGVYTRESVDRYLLARHLTAQARLDGYTARALLWPDKNGSAAWNGHIYKQE